MHAMLLSIVLFAQDDTTTFCQNWTKGSPADRLEFLLEPEAKLLDELKRKGMSDGNIATFKVCFENNISKLRNRLDQDCTVEQRLTEFFQTQVDTSSQEYDHINDYVNMCATTEGQST